MYDVVVATVAQQMRENLEPKAYRWTDSTPPRMRVKRRARTQPDDPNAGGRVHGFVGVPLAARQVGYVVPRREPAREAAIPALRAANRMGIQAIVNDADT